MAVDFDVVLHLDNIDPIEHVQEALTLDGHGQFLVKHAENDIGSLLVGGCNCKVVNLAHEHNTLAVNNSGVYAWLVSSWGQAKIMEDSIGMLFPKSQ